MPTPSMDLKGLSSPTYFSEDSCFPSQAQVRSCKSEVLPEQYGTNGRKPFDSPNFQNFTPSDHLEPFSLHDRELKLGSDQYTAQNAKSTADRRQLLRSLEHEHGSVAGFSAAQALFADPRASGRVPPYENSLFSSSLPELFSRKLKLSARGTHFDKSMDAAPLHYDEGEPFTSSEEIEARTIGNLLPDDDDLLSGVTDGLDFAVQQPNGDDLEELDVFSNMGGMDLEDSDSSATQKNINLGNNSLAAHNDQLSRILFVRNINSNIEDSELQLLFEQYGEVRNLYTACKQRGLIMISYYDIRAARKAMESLQNRTMRDRRLDIHYSIPTDNPSEKDTNQGIILVSNLDSSVSNDDLHSIFSGYGDIREIQNVTQRNPQRLIEYFDIRAAEAALRALNGSNIAGKQIKLDRFPSGRIKEFLQLSNELEQNSPSNHSLGFSGRIPFGGISSSGMENGTAMGMKSSMRGPFIGSPVHHGASSFVPDGLPSLLRVESGNLQGQLKYDIQESANFHPHSLPEYQDGFMNGIHSSPNLMGANFGQRLPEVMDSRQLHRIGSNGHSLEQGVYGSPGSSPITGHHLMWGSNSYRSQPPSGMMWQNSPSSYLNGIARLHSLPSSMLNAAAINQTNNLHHVGSAPSVNPAAIWDRQQQQQQPYVVGSPESSSFHPGSLGNMRISKSSLHSVDFGQHNMFPPHVGVDPSKVIGIQSPHRMMFSGRAGQMVGPGMSSFEPPNERIRSRRNEGAASSQADKKQFELDVDRIIRGEDKRTTLMIKNIPNKYTSKMLLAAIDEFHRGTYDFIYLPIDFKNKCNVGYAFINMIDPTQIIPFYKAFNGKKWEKFNSEKVASLAYGRIQGKSALIAHFQNSSLMNEDKRCRPILFNTEGPNAGDQVPFPMGVNVRSRPGKTRGSCFEENQQEVAESSNRDSSTSPSRDSE